MTTIGTKCSRRFATRWLSFGNDWDLKQERVFMKCNLNQQGDLERKKLSEVINNEVTIGD